MKGDNYRVLLVKDGINYYFDYVKFKQQYNDTAIERGGPKPKTILKEQIHDLLGYEISTIEGWLKGNSSPDLDAVRKLENFFAMPPDSFLTSQTKAMQKK